MTNLDSVIKRIDSTLLTKVYMVFPVVMYGCDSWAIKKAECWRIDTLKNWYFETVALGRTHESPLDCKEIKPVNAKENQSWIFIQGLILKVKCQYFGHLMWRASSVQFSCSVVWTTAHQASLSITKSRSLPKLMSIQLVMSSNHLILCQPLLLLPPIPPSIRVFSNESTLCIRWPKYWSFSFSISTSNEHSGLISFRMDWLDFLALQGTLKSLLQHYSSKASILMVCEAQGCVEGFGGTGDLLASAWRGKNWVLLITMDWRRFGAKRKTVLSLSCYGL